MLASYTLMSIASRTLGLFLSWKSCNMPVLYISNSACNFPSISFHWCLITNAITPSLVFQFFIIHSMLPSYSSDMKATNALMVHSTPSAVSFPANAPTFSFPDSKSCLDILLYISAILRFFWYSFSLIFFWLLRAVNEIFSFTLPCGSILR